MKHTDEYARLFPKASILVLTIGYAEFMFKSSSSLISEYAAAVPFIQPNTRMTLLSNGGAMTAIALARAYGKPLPVSASIFDSAPGKAAADTAYAGMSLGIPKTPVLREVLIVFLWAWIYAYGFLMYFGVPTSIETNRRLLNDSMLFVKGKRCYVYSKEDRIVQDWAVLEHAEEAKVKGWDVRTEQFSGPHVAHAVKEKERYWGIVEETFGAME